MYLYSDVALEVETRAVEERLGMHNKYRPVGQHERNFSIPKFLLTVWQGVLTLF